MVNNQQENRVIRVGRGGFTSIELLISSVILGMIVIVSYGFWRYFTESFDFSFGKSVSLSDAYRGTSQIVRELRETTIAENGAYPLEIVNQQELAFYADIDEDGEAERVRYWLGGSNLMKGIIQPSGDPVIYDTDTETARIVVEGVVNASDPVFYYYNSDWPSDTVNNPLQTDIQLDTRMITIDLSLLASVDKTASPSSITSSVALRRLLDN